MLLRKVQSKVLKISIHITGYYSTCLCAVNDLYQILHLHVYADMYLDNCLSDEVMLQNWGATLFTTLVSILVILPHMQDICVSVSRVGLSRGRSQICVQDKIPSKKQKH